MSEQKKTGQVQVSEQELNQLREDAAKMAKYKAINERSRLRRQARIAILLEKAEKAGITVSEAEVDARLAK